MKHLLAAVLVLQMCLAAAAGEGESAEQYRKLLLEYNAASGAFRKAETDQQRKVAVEQLDTFPQRFLDLADENPEDAAALLALRQAVQAVNSVDSLAQVAWEMNRTAFPAGSQGDAAGRAVTLLLRDHARSDQLGAVCDRMRYGVRWEYKRFLATVARTNPHRDVQGLACLALAQLHGNQLQMLDLVADRPELAKRYDFIFGKDYLRELRRPGRAALAARVEELWEQAAEYTGVKMPYGGTVGEKARSVLHEIRHLSIGKTAPEIEGRDQDGRQFRLSDYRGKVVLLYFWMEL